MKEDSIMFRDEIQSTELDQFIEFFDRMKMSYSISDIDEYTVRFRIFGKFFDFVNGNLQRGNLS